MQNSAMSCFNFAFSVFLLPLHWLGWLGASQGIWPVKTGSNFLKWLPANKDKYKTLQAIARTCTVSVLLSLDTDVHTSTTTHSHNTGYSGGIWLSNHTNNWHQSMQYNKKEPLNKKMKQQWLAKLKMVQPLLTTVSQDLFCITFGPPTAETANV